jgi:hypothetical protein
MPAEWFVDRARYLYAATQDDVTGDLIRNVVVTDGGIDALPRLAKLIPALDVAGIVPDTIAWEVLDDVA